MDSGSPLVRLIALTLGSWCAIACQPPSAARDGLLSGLSDTSAEVGPDDLASRDAAPSDSADFDSDIGAGRDIDTGLQDALHDPDVFAADATPADAPRSPDVDADLGAGVETPLPGFGDISGECGVLDAELFAPTSSAFVNRIDFGDDPFDDPEDVGLLTSGGRAILAAGNAGGSSIESEVFSFEVLARCELATLLATETEVDYRAGWAGSITDLLVEIDGTRIGVSVTRAVGFPRDDPYTVAQAEELLRDKLAGVLESSEGVATSDAWAKQILHVIAYGEEHVVSLLAAFDGIDPTIKAATVLWITESAGDDAFLY